MNITTVKTGKAAFLPYLYTAGKVLLVALTARVQFAGAYPLGISLAAAVAEENVFAAILGLALGVAGSAQAALKYLSAAIIYGVMVYARRFEKRQVKAVALGAALMMSSVITLLRFGVAPARLLIVVPEAFAVGGLYLLFGNIRGKGMAAYAAEMLIIGGVLTSVFGIVIPYAEVNVAVFLAMLTVMSASYACGIPVAVMTGAILGFMTFLNRPEAVEMSGLFSLSALFAAVAAKTGKTGVSAGFLSGATVCLLCMGRMSALSVADVFAAPIIFLILPQKTAVKIGSHISSKLEEASCGEEVAERIKTVAKAVGDLADGVKAVYNKKKEGSGICAGLTERVCRGCRNEEICTGKEQPRPEEITGELKKTLERDGFLNYSNLPESVRRNCMQAERFLGEFLHMTEMGKQKELLLGEGVAAREIMARQFGEISEVINTLSCENEKENEEKYSVAVSVCQEAKGGQEINGDTVMHFQKGNKYYIILCDGMGSGAAAREISGLTAHLFAEFFGSGIEKKRAVSMINSALALNADRESFSSADILEIDLCTGAAEFLKIGSAQSFIKRNMEVEEVSSSSLPVGILENIAVSPQKYTLSEGDEILMITDGIGEAGSGIFKNEWIKKLFLSFNKTGEDNVRLLLEGARARAVYSDDMTAVIIKIERDGKI